MKIGSKRNLNKAEVYHRKSRSPAAPSEALATAEMDLMKNSDEPIKKIRLPTGN